MHDEDGDIDGGGRAAGRSSDEAVQRAVRVLRGFFARNRQRDGLRYGIEVKNTLGYSNLGEEVQLKIELALHLGCQPLFVARMLPKAWNHAIIEAKGRVLLFGWQLHPKTNQGIVLRMHEELGLPVKVARDLPEGDMQRFLAAHQKLVAELGDRGDLTV